MTKRFNAFAEFYPFYLDEHKSRRTKIFHFVGTSLFFAALLFSFFTKNAFFILGGIALAYGFAWFSHYFFEKNRPATFRYPLYSARADFVLYFELLTRKRKF